MTETWKPIEGEQEVRLLPPAGELQRLLHKPQYGQTHYVGQPPPSCPACDAGVPANPARRRFLGGAALVAALGGGLALDRIVRPATARLDLDSLRPYLSPKARAAAYNLVPSTIWDYTEGGWHHVAPARYISATVYTPDRSGLLPVSFHQEWARMLNRFAEEGWVASLAPFASIQLVDRDTWTVPGPMPDLTPERQAEFERMKRAVYSFLFFRTDAPVVKDWAATNPVTGPRPQDHFNRYFGMLGAQELPEGHLQQTGSEVEGFRSMR